ncbi:META domain-containing protein [Salidesulfovibrio onnuriiensis]|uniref:META domain-containing protein n=1 Tax=Salidesulfovibrio onnuriiensis TaxID=2583823 RepID=UPI0011CC3959|nr:META domain-containing protein [Salidesulfovibrio onnuriiensis]
MKKILLLTICLLLLAACAKKPGQLDMGSILDREWTLEYDGDKPVIDASNVTIVFKDDGKVGGRSGCNNYTGSWKLENGKLSMGPFASTRMMCPGALMEQETRFLQHLQQATSLDVDKTGALLIFVDGMDKPMLFRE